MLNNLLNKIFNRNRDNRGKKDKEPKPQAPAPSSSVPERAVESPAPAPLPPAQAPPPPPKKQEPSAGGARNRDIPNRLEEGLPLKVVPENLKGKPRAWDVVITALDSEGIWVARSKSDDEPIPAEKGKLLSLVLMEENKTITYDCPVLRITKEGLEHILVGPPTKTVSEDSQVRNIGARKHLRISFRLPAEIRKVQGTELGPPSSAHTRDISMTGLALDTNAQFDAGEEIEVRILSWNFPLNVRAFVIRCSPTDDKNTVAVSFPPGLSMVSSDLISQFILENQRR